VLCKEYFGTIDSNAHRRKKQYPYFQQDNIVPHTSQHSVEALYEIFGERIINQGLWTPHLSDLRMCNCYIWGKFKQNM
jgi:hypothetical protein